MAPTRAQCAHIQEWLYDYLKIEVDPYDFQFAIKDWIEREEITDGGTPYADPYDVQVDDLSDEQLKAFTKWLKKSGELELYQREMPYEAPAYLTLRAQSKLATGSWFIHFSNSSFARFDRGATLEGLHLSTWSKNKALADCSKNLSDQQGLAETVFGFAFNMDGMSLRDVHAGSKKYGNHAVVFQCDCAVEAYHSGDEEYQSIFPVCSEYNLHAISIGIVSDGGEGLGLDMDDGNVAWFAKPEALIEHLETKPKRRRARKVEAQEAWSDRADLCDDARVWYHGSHHRFDEFKVRVGAPFGGDPMAVPIFLTCELSTARMHAGPNGFVYTVRARPKQVFRGQDLFLAEYPRWWPPQPEEMASIGRRLYEDLEAGRVFADVRGEQADDALRAIARSYYDIMESGEMKQWLLDHGYDAFTVREAPRAPVSLAVMDPSRLQIEKVQHVDETQRQQAGEPKKLVAPPTTSRVFQPGESVFFEYHCWQDERSADAELWYHTRQWATVVRALHAPEVDVESDPAYELRFDDGFVAEAQTDEVYESPPPNPKKRGVIVPKGPYKPRWARESVQDLATMTVEQLEREPTDVLDRLAFGVGADDIVEVPLDKISIRYAADFTEAQRQVSSDAIARGYLKANETIPVDIDIRDDGAGGVVEWVLDDGHHRYVSAQRLHAPTLRAKIKVSAHPINEILRQRNAAGPPEDRARWQLLARKRKKMRMMEDGPEAAALRVTKHGGVHVDAGGCEVDAVREDDRLRVISSMCGHGKRGHGYGVVIYKALVDHGLAHGLDVVSDFTVEPAAAHVWEALQRRGYDVVKNPDATLVTSEEGTEFWYVGHGLRDVPVFEVHAGTRVAHEDRRTAALDPRIDELVAKYMAILGVDTRPDPISVHDNVGSSWLGRCIWHPARLDRDADGAPLFRGPSTSMELQRSIMADDTTLERIIAHEMVHHWDFMTRTDEEREHLQVMRRAGIKDDGHGDRFKRGAAIVNEAMGPGFVTRYSDEAMVQVNTKPIFVLIGEYTPGKLGYKWAVRLNDEAKWIIDREIANGARLVTTTDLRWTQGKAKIKKYSGWNVPLIEAPLRALYDAAGPQTTVPTGAEEAPRRILPAFLRSGEAAWRWAKKNVDLSYDDDPETERTQKEEYAGWAATYASFATRVENAEYVDVYRMICVPEMSFVQLQNLGKAWSRYAQGAGCYGQAHNYGALGNREILVHGRVRPQDVDWQYGFTSFMYYGESQWEISLNENVPVQVLSIEDVRDSKTKQVFNPPAQGNTGHAQESWQAQEV